MHVNTSHLKHDKVSFWYYTITEEKHIPPFLTMVSQTLMDKNKKNTIKI